MEKKEEEPKKFKFVRYGNVFRNPIRPQIIHCLKQGPATAKTIATHIGITPQDVSYHLHQLKVEELVRPAFKTAWAARTTGFELTESGHTIETFLDTHFDFESPKKKDAKKEAE